MFKRYSEIFKKVSFSTIMVIISLPLFESVFGIFNPMPLNGWIPKVEKPKFSWVSWFDGDFQDMSDNYFQANFGFRSIAIRFNNQMAYSFYDVAKANGVEIGKQEYLYESHYIQAYYGNDFSGEELIKEKVWKLSKIRDTLLTKGIEIAVVMTPGKASFYPEFFPEKYDHDTKKVTNYEFYKDEFEAQNILNLDLKQWFLLMKDTATYPLFPKTGIHWSKYSELVAGDSIIGFVQKTLERKLPRWKISGVVVTEEVRETDDDIEKGMNILFDIPDLKMAYPQFSIVEDSNSYKPKVLCVADSYYWGIFNYGLSRDIFNGGQFWYYNKQIYPDSYEKEIMVQDISIIDEVEKNEMILLVTSDASLFHFAFGFIDELYEAYYGHPIK